MQSYLLAISLPKIIRSQLALLCYGLPQVNWVEEENFHLTLRFLGLLSDETYTEVHQRLSSLFFIPFMITLNGLGNFHSKNRGSIWVGVENDENIIALKKEINQHLKGLILPPTIREIPHITIGHYERINSEKLKEYFFAHADFNSGPITVNSCVLMRCQQTPKRMIYQIVDSFSASESNTGED